MTQSVGKKRERRIGLGCGFTNVCLANANANASATANRGNAISLIPPIENKGSYNIFFLLQEKKIERE